MLKIGKLNVGKLELKIGKLNVDNWKINVGKLELKIGIGENWNWRGTENWPACSLRGCKMLSCDVQS